jgi:tetratricopeptide (TPR) repeat protein
MEVGPAAKEASVENDPPASVNADPVAAPIPSEQVTENELPVSTISETEQDTEDSDVEATLSSTEEVSANLSPAVSEARSSTTNEADSEIPEEQELEGAAEVVTEQKPSATVGEPVSSSMPGGNGSTPQAGNNGKDPKSAFEWNCLGNVYLKAGSYDEAISAYTNAIDLAPKVGWPYRNLASAYFYKGMTAVAIPLYKRSIELLNNNTEKAASLNKLGDAYRQMGDYQNAMVAYQKADDLSAGINSLLNKARMLVSANSGQD